MRKLKNLVIAAVLFLGVNASVTAQTKVAHINLSELIPLMPELKVAQDQEELNKRKFEYQERIKEVNKQIEESNYRISLIFVQPSPVLTYCPSLSTGFLSLLTALNPSFVNTG